MKNPKKQQQQKNVNQQKLIQFSFPFLLFSLSINRGKNKAWTEEQEEELRHLFMRNQESPETDQDVIDWIVENL